MFNPRFVRRAANLLQSGAIMNKNFHPYESHVPYILQFMIDYNLYGMSFVHIPLDVVKFRQAGDEHNLRGKFFYTIHLRADIYMILCTNRVPHSCAEASTVS